MKNNLLQTSIDDVLTLKKYSALTHNNANILYRHFFDADVFEVRSSSPYAYMYDNMQYDGYVKEDNKYDSFQSGKRRFKIDQLGKEFVKAVNARIETYKNKNFEFNFSDNMKTKKTNRKHPGGNPGLTKLKAINKRASIIRENAGFTVKTEKKKVYNMKQKDAVKKAALAIRAKEKARKVR